MSLFRQSTFAALAAIILTASKFTLSAIIARKLTTVDFGQFIYTQLVIDTSFLACSLGVTGAASRFIAEYRGNESLLNAFLDTWRPWSLALPLLSGIVAVIGINLSGYELKIDALIFLALWSTSNGLWAIQTASLSGYQRFDLILISNTFASIIMLAGAFWLPLENGNPASLFGLMATAAGLATLPGLNQTFFRTKSSHPKNLPNENFSTIRKYAINMWLIALLWAFVWSRGEVMIVRYYLGDNGVASYAAALTIFNGAIQGAMLGMAAIAPQLTKLWREDRLAEAFILTRNTMDYQLLVCGIGASILIYLGPELLTLIFGSSYREQSVTLATLSVGLISMALANQNHLLQIASNGRFTRNSSLVGLLVLGGFSVMMAPIAGVKGVATARLATLIFLATLSTYKFYRWWGKKGLSFFNLILVFLLSFGSMILFFQIKNWSISLRMSLLVFNIVFLLFFLRNSDGKPSALNIFHK